MNLSLNPLLVKMIMPCISGLPDTVLQKAAAKSQEFEDIYGKQRKGRKLSTEKLEDELVVFLQVLNNVAESLSCLESADSTSIYSLTKLKDRARTILPKN